MFINLIKTINLSHRRYHASPISHLLPTFTAENTTTSLIYPFIVSLNSNKSSKSYRPFQTFTISTFSCDFALEQLWIEDFVSTFQIFSESDLASILSCFSFQDSHIENELKDEF